MDFLILLPKKYFIYLYLNYFVIYSLYIFVFTINCGTITGLSYYKNNNSIYILLPIQVIVNQTLKLKTYIN